MRPVAFVLVALALATGTVAFFVSVTGRSPTGCRLKSVDEAEYVAGNRAILDNLPVYPGAARKGQMVSIGQSASDGCNPLAENGPPYDAFTTYDLFTLPPKGRRIMSAPWNVPDEFGNTWSPAQVPMVLVYYDRELRARGWQRTGWSGYEVYFRRDTASLAISAQLNIGDPYKREPTYELNVDHDRYG